MADAMGINVLSVVKLHGVCYVGNASHSEDYYYTKIEPIDTIVPSDTFLQKFIDDVHSCIFGNKGRAVAPEDFLRGDYSLMLIRTQGCEIYLDQRYTPKPRIKFTYKNVNYDFPITDPVILTKLRANSTLYKSGYGVVYIVASLGLEHEGWHSKLAATIIFPATNSIKETINVKEATLKDCSPLQSSNRSSSLKMDANVSSAMKERNTLRVREETNRRIQTQNQRRSKQGCYIATAVYGSYHCPEVCALRRFRDNVLALSWYGRLFIKVYYQTSPYIVKNCGKSKLLQLLVKPTLDKFVKRLNRKGFSSTPYKDRI